MALAFCLCVPCHFQVFLVDNSIHSVVRCANYYGLFSLDEIEAESKVSTPLLLGIKVQYVVAYIERTFY